MPANAHELGLLAKADPERRLRELEEARANRARSQSKSSASAASKGKSRAGGRRSSRKTSRDGSEDEDDGEAPSDQDGNDDDDDGQVSRRHPPAGKDVADTRYRYDGQDEDSDDDGDASYSSQSDSEDEGDDDEDDEEGKISDDDDDAIKRGPKKPVKKGSKAKPKYGRGEEDDQEDDQGEEERVPDHLKEFVPGDLRTVFAREPKEVLEERKLRSQLPMDRSPLKESNASGGMVAYDYFNNPVIPLPARPAWDSSWSKEQLESAELDEFKRWLRDLYATWGGRRLNWFEHNLEVWRQLWRTVERSDVLLCLADARNPLLNFPPALFDLVTRSYGKPAVVVLNKVDLVSEARVQEWLEHFRVRYPHVPVVPFTSHPYLNPQQPYFQPEEQRARISLSRKTAPPFGADQLLDTIREVLQGKVPEEVLEQISFQASRVLRHRTQKHKIAPRRNDENQQRFVTIGMLGPPNAGKSSFINSLASRKLVSVSRTPGHTKHLQTIFLNPATCLCDCPGLVFPAVDMPRPLQVLFGLFPVAQLREPYSTVQYLGERVRLEDTFELRKVYPDREWSGWEMCEAYALRKNYRTQGGGLDAYRAANEMLRRLHEGNRAAQFSYRPPALEAQQEQVEDENGKIQAKDKAAEQVHDEQAGESPQQA